jgi:hypothetical protein
MIKEDTDYEFDQTQDSCHGRRSHSNGRSAAPVCSED